MLARSLRYENTHWYLVGLLYGAGKPHGAGSVDRHPWLGDTAL